MLGTKIRVAIITERKFLRELLERFLNRKLCACVCRANQLVSSGWSNGSVSLNPILLVDVATARLSTLAFVREALRPPARCRAILFAMPLDKTLLFETLRWGVTGYVIEEAGASEILEAVRLAAQGEFVCPPALFQLVSQHLAKSAASNEDTNRLGGAKVRSAALSRTS